MELCSCIGCAGRDIKCPQSENQIKEEIKNTIQTSSLFYCVHKVLTSCIFPSFVIFLTLKMYRVFFLSQYLKEENKSLQMDVS